jgi:phosphoglycolate phosphatase-like HAD superfamily hydrolase
MVGDKPSDVAAGKAIGATTVWLAFGRDYPAGGPKPDFTETDWTNVASTLLQSVANPVAA